MSKRPDPRLGALHSELMAAWHAWTTAPHPQNDADIVTYLQRLSAVDAAYQALLHQWLTYAQDGPQEE